jgi:GNAT superfamily N-acetyltransferase
MPANPPPLTALTAEDLRAWHRVRSAALAHDQPGEPVPSQAAMRARLTAPDGDRHHLLWLLRGHAGEPVATGTLRLPADPVDGADPSDGAGGTGQIDLVVHPAHRRLGTGSRLLATVTEAALGAGCGSVVGEVVAGTSAEGFLAMRDFVAVQRRTWQGLALDDIPAPVAKLPDVPHPGYRLTAWEGAPPATLATAFAAALRTLPATPAKAGHPPGESRWDPERVPQSAALAAGRGDRLLTVAALADDDTLAGYTTALLPADPSASRAVQYDTAVVPSHRGHGLGMWLKSELLRRVPSSHPGVTELHAAVPEDHRHLLSLNASLGFRTLRRTVRYRLSLRPR